MSKVNHVAYIDEPIYGPSLHSTDSSLAVVTYCRKDVHLDRMSTHTGREHSELLGQFRESDLGCNTLDFMMTS